MVYYTQLEPGRPTFWHWKLNFWVKNKKVTPIQTEVALEYQAPGRELRSCLCGVIPADCKQWVVPSRGSWTAAKTPAVGRPILASEQRWINALQFSGKCPVSKHCGTVAAGIFKTSHLSLYSFPNVLFSLWFYCIFSITCQIGRIEIVNLRFISWRDTMILFPGPIVLG